MTPIKNMRQMDVSCCKSLVNVFPSQQMQLLSHLQSEEKKLVAEIKRTAKTGNEAATKILARQLVRLRQQIANLQSSQAQMRGISTNKQALAAHSSVAVGVKGATKA
ncbi:hypothetical protein QVD17_18904 [Tagetes erecta]|uniref:Uncharacterized protein n=1 Tax=Tagetes erecta TaxID=13708 RepID=A0AAD8KIK2_TARER|nr:hypothetical protein QVD17_32236 [Tagetes erecta]KAK1423599.1 hypothetical protein QVD17_18904 [Tagetes erecta]